MPLQLKLARIITAALFTAVIAGTWDIWWHGALGRDTFWIPPHLLLYAGTLCAVVTGIYAYAKTRSKTWLILAIILLLVPLSAPFDELWHRTFGVETAEGPLIIWSPPHLVLIFSIMASAIAILPILLRDKDPIGKLLFSSIAFAVIIGLANVLAAPLFPLGPYHLLDYFGAFFEHLPYVLILLFARKNLKGVGTATTVTAFALIVFSIGFAHNPAPVINVPLHDHAPMWLVSFSMLTPALFLDIAYKKVPWPFLGLLFALISNAIFYFPAPYFFEPEFKYSWSEASIATLSGALAGILAGILASLTKTRFKK